MLILSVAENIFIKMYLKILDFWIISPQISMTSLCGSPNKIHKQKNRKTKCPEVFIHCELLI